MPTKKSPRVSGRKNPKPVIKKVDYLGLDHEAVKAKMNPNVTFINYMSVKGSKGGEFVAAVYYDSKPNRELNHREYMLIYSVFDPFTNESKLYVTGRSKEQLEAERFHSATLCTQCGTVLISLSGHHFHGCKCPNGTCVDGGQSKWGTRVLAKDLSKAVNVRVDMLTDKIYVRKRKK